jgi:hypothetical protein
MATPDTISLLPLPCSLSTSCFPPIDTFVGAALKWKISKLQKGDMLSYNHDMKKSLATVFGINVSHSCIQI